MKHRNLRRALLDLSAWMFLITAAALALRAGVSLARIGFVLATGHEPEVLGQLPVANEAVATSSGR